MKLSSAVVSLLALIGAKAEVAENARLGFLRGNEDPGAIQIANQATCVNLGDEGCYYARFNEDADECCPGSVCNYVGRNDSGDYTFQCVSPTVAIQTANKATCVDLGDEGCYYARFNENADECCPGSVCNYVGRNDSGDYTFQCVSPTDAVQTANQATCVDLGDEDCYYARFNEDADECCPGSVCNYVGRNDSGDYAFQCVSPTDAVQTANQATCVGLGDEDCYYARFNEDTDECCPGSVCNYVGRNDSGDYTFQCVNPTDAVQTANQATCVDLGDEGCYYARFNEDADECCPGSVCNYVGRNDSGDYTFQCVSPTDTIQTANQATCVDLGDEGCYYARFNEDADECCPGSVCNYVGRNESGDYTFQCVSPTDAIQTAIQATCVDLGDEGCYYARFNEDADECCPGSVCNYIGRNDSGDYTFQCVSPTDVVKTT